MKSVVLFLSLAQFAIAAPVSQRQVFSYLTRFEGLKMVPYSEAGQMVVGVGHTLLEEPKASYSEDEIGAFFSSDFALAVRTCRKGVLDFDDLPADAQLVAIGLAHSCGANGFAKWIRFRNALSSRNFRFAAIELRKSKWWKQVGSDRAMDCYSRLVRIK